MSHGLNIPIVLVVAAMVALPRHVRAQGPHRGESVARSALATTRPVAPPIAWFRLPALLPVAGRPWLDGVPAQVPPDRWFAPDKLRHFFLSFGAAGITHATLRAADARDTADWLSPSLTMLAGLAKEIVDHDRGWGFSLKDLAWDAGGVVVAMIAMREIG